VQPLNDPVAVTVEATITNLGDRAGAEVVQVYVGDRSQTLQTPEQELRAFTKVHLAPGKAQQVRLEIARDDLSHYHPEAGWVYAGGSNDIRVGSSSRDIRLHMSADIPGHPVEVPLTLWS